MGVLYALESIRTPVLDKIMLIISELGGEAPFLIIAIAVFWCIDKRKGYYLMTVGFFGMILNQFLKILCCVPRPWVKDPADLFSVLQQQNRFHRRPMRPPQPACTAPNLFVFQRRRHR